MMSKIDARYELLDQGQTCLANIKTDQELINWAGDRAVYIGRWIENKKYHYQDSKWRNPHKDKPNEIAVAKYRDYLLAKPVLLKQIEELRGKLLMCWCLPDPCHGQVLIDLLNQKDSL
jgi:hypothetical protein